MAASGRAGGRVVGVAVAAATFLIGLGFQVGGFRLEWLGWTLLFLGLAIGLIALISWFWPRFAAAVVRTGLTSDPSLSKRSSPVIAQARAAADAKIAAEEERRERDLRAAMRKVVGELDYNRKMLEAAQREKRYWDPRNRSLVAGTWHEHYVLLAGERDLGEAYRLTEDAYHETDRLNHLVRDRYGPVRVNDPFYFAGPPPSVEDGDDLGGAITVINTARNALQDATGQLGSKGN